MLDELGTVHILCGMALLCPILICSMAWREETEWKTGSTTSSGC